MLEIMLRGMHLGVKCIQFYEKVMKIMISVYLKCKIKKAYMDNQDSSVFHIN